MLLATIVANTVPAKHAIIQEWPYSFRFSLAATWGDPTVMARVWSGVGLLATAGGIWAFGRLKHWDRKLRLGLPALLAVIAPAWVFLLNGIVFVVAAPAVGDVAAMVARENQPLIAVPVSAQNNGACQSAQMNPMMRLAAIGLRS